MDRRLALKCLGIAAAAGVSSIRAAGAAHAADVHWGYSEANGPERWAALSPEFKTCAIGTQQAPIDLKGAVKAQLGRLDVRYGPIPLRVVNNGHTIQVNVSPGAGNRLTLGDKRFDLQQFHFHAPSEHLLDGKRFGMELHLVHASAEKEFAVLGVLMALGKPNPALAPIWSTLSDATAAEKTTGGDFDPATLLPRKSRAFYRYNGSLTTPPCSEGVNWVVFREPIEVGEEQARKFADLFHGNNARPVQPLNRRFVLETM